MRYRNRAGYILFICAYALCMIDGMLFGLSTFGELRHAEIVSWLLRGAAAFVVVLKLIMDRFYTKEVLIYMVCTGLLLTVIFLRSGYNHVFYLLIISLGIRGMDSERVIRFDYWLRIWIMLFIILCSVFGIIENYVTYRTGTDEYRQSLGFNHPNTLASMIMGIMLEAVYIYRLRFNWVYAISIWIVGVVVYVVTLNRTSVFMIMLLPLLLLLIENRKNKAYISPFASAAVMAIFPALLVLSFAAMKLCGRSMLLGLLDRLMSNRFTNALFMYEQYGVPLLGQRVTLISIKIARALNSGIALLDVAYLRMLIQAGPFVLIQMGGMYMAAVKQACKFNNRHMLLALGMLAVFGISESGYNNICMNFSLIMMAVAPFAYFDGIGNKNVIAVDEDMETVK